MKVLSYSDVITNSSSEVFVLHPKPEVNREEFLSEINELLDSLCEITGYNPDALYRTSISDYEGVDESWWYYQAVGDIIIESVDDNSIPYWMVEAIEDICYLPKFKDKFSGYYAEDLGKKELPRERWNREKGNYEKVTEPTEIKSIQRTHLG